jgi:hypothetical protein
MKTLMRMFASQDRGVIFFESCITLRHQKHTTIEVLPLPFALFDEIPAYFQVCPVAFYPGSPPDTQITLTGSY